MVFLKKKCDSKGFTLIEVLVSMMVVAVTLTVIMSLFSGGLKSKKRAQDYIQAVQLANSKMNQIILEQDFEPGTREGDFENGYFWKIEVLPEEENEDSTIELKEGLKSYIISVEVSWKQGENKKKYTIKTIQRQETKSSDGVYSS